MYSQEDKTAKLLFPTEEQCKYNTRVKAFGEEMVKTSCFSRPIFNPLHVVPAQILQKPQKRSGSIQSELKRLSSIKRAKDKVFEIAYANSFTYFITLTLNENIISRTDTETIKKALYKWLNNLVNRNAAGYILLPEYHHRQEKDGNRAIHFHGLIFGNLKLHDSGKKTSKGQPIYNLENWRYGFSTVIELYGDKKACLNYITKYITKDSNKILGRYYLSGGPLHRSVPTEYLNCDYNTFDGREYNIMGTLSVKYRTDINE